MMTSSAPGAVAASPFRRPTRLALAAIAAVLLVCGAALYAWSMDSHSQSAQPPAALAYAVTGIAVTEGGPPTFPAGGSDIRPDEHATIVIVGVSTTGTRIRRIELADRHGRFALRLPAGSYTVSAVEFGQLPLRRQPHATVRVIPGKPVHIRLRGYAN